MSIAIPEIINEYPAISKTVMGSVLTVFFVTYAVGQFVNSHLVDRYGGKKILAIGIIVSSFINIIFGFLAGNVILMLLLWGLNGFFQSMGWSSAVKTIANWFTSKTRGREAGLLGTSYLIGNGLSLVFAGFLVSILNWRWIFWIPAAICILVAILWIFKSSDTPAEASPSSVGKEYGTGHEPAETENQYPGFKPTVKLVLLNKGMWIIAVSMFFLDFIRIGLMFWAITYIFETEKVAVSIAAFRIMIIPISGSIGAYFSSWFAGRFLKRWGVRIIPLMLFLLVIFCFLFLFIFKDNWILSIWMLVFIGFFLYGPHVLISSFLPIELVPHKASASAAGFVSGLAYTGSALTSFLSGFLADNFGWNSVFYMWISGGIAAAVLMSFLWNYKPIKKSYN